MTAQNNPSKAINEHIKLERTYFRFSLSQRWEHLIVFLTVTVLLFTGLPQKYPDASWSQWIISSPEKLTLIQQIHHIVALILTAEVVYHLGKAVYLMVRRHLKADIFPNPKDFRDAWQMILKLLYLSKKEPRFGKYNFEQKLTYWFLFFSIGLMVVSGFILWFPLLITRFLPGGLIPAALLAHSNEALVTLVFIVIWHFFHVHIERLNLSIFTGRLTEEEMRKYHADEYQAIESDAANPDTELGGNL